MATKSTKGLLPVLFIFALAELCHGQTIISSVVGQVTDTTGAVVPGVQITVTNEGTTISAQAITDSKGTYSVPNLYAGVYRVEARKEGFELAGFTGIRVLAAQTVRQDVVLKVGSVSQSVTVSSSSPLVHTDSINIAGEITNRQLSDLPVLLQSIDTMLTLVPGAQTVASSTSPQTGGVQFWGGTNFNVNGVAANDSTNGRGAVGYGTGAVALPPIGSIQEFKVNVNNMNAEYRMQATVDMVTKQGSNKFHGEAYEYNQNVRLAANSFTLNAAGKPRVPFNRNQFGGNVGGPIWRNKVFFFMNFSGFRQRQYTTVSLNFPSAAMRAGNFAALCPNTASGASGFSGANGICTTGTQLYNPFTGAPFPNNQITQGTITSQAQTLVTFLPQLTIPNSPGLPNEAPNYVGSISAARDFDAYDLRLDWQLSAKDSLTGFFTHNVGFPWFQPLGTPPNYGNGSNFGYKTIIYHLAESHTFSPSTTNDLRVGWFNFPQIRNGQNANFDPRSLFPQQPASPQRGLPKMTFTGYGPIGDYGQGLYRYQPSVEILENFTHVHGRHTLKAGADFTFYSWFVPSPQASLPSFAFSGVWTGNKGNPGQPQSQGNAFADFLLGVFNSSSTSTPGHDTKFYDKDWELYFQDTWQASRKLTVYFGVRYMNQEPWTIRDNLRSYFDRTVNKLALPENSSTPTLPPFGADPSIFNAFLPNLTTTKALGLPLNYIQDDNNNWGPRVGFAYRPFADGKTVLRGGYGVYYAFTPVGLGTLDDALNVPFSGTSGAIAAPLSFQSALPGSPTSQFLPDLTFSNPFPSGSGGAVFSTHPSLYPMQRNFVLPVTQSWNLTLEHQLGASNMVRASYVGNQTHHMTWYYADINVPSAQTPNVPIQNQRPLQPWADMDATLSGAKQNFNQLQLEYIRRFARGLTAQAEYQWTSSLTNADLVGGPQNPVYPKLDYGNSDYVVRHMLVFNYVYELPFGRGKQWLSRSSSVIDSLLGGWEVAGITNYRTGTPFTTSFQVPSNYVGWWGGRADRVSSNLYAKQSGHNITNGIQWFNPAAFAAPQPWQWGNSAPFSVWGPGSWDWDISMQKSFLIPIRMLEAPRLQFRADFFDAFNHFNLSNPSSTIADTRDGGSPIATAGKIYGGSGNRTIQLGLKFSF